MRPEDGSAPVAVCIKQSQCLGCAICVDVCPHGALAMDRTDLFPRQITGRCTACSACVAQCPTQALYLPPGYTK